MEDPIIESLNSIPDSRVRLPVDSDIEPQDILEHIALVLTATLGASRQDLESDGSFLAHAARADSLQKCSQFSGQSHSAVYVQQDLITSATTPQTPIRYTLTLRISYSESTVACLALLKRSVVLVSSCTLASQLSVLDLPGAAGYSDASSSPYDALRALVQYGMAPFFDAYTTTHNLAATQQPSIENDKGVSAAKKRFTELQLSLRNLQENIQIPRLHLEIHPQVQAAVDGARLDGARPNLSFIAPESRTDANFLNALQAGVNTWTHSVQEAANRSRDPNTGSAKQEKDFWATMDEELASIARQQASDEVQLTLSILRQVKRHSTVQSFDTETGLVIAREKVGKYNEFLRTIPLQKLLEADSFDEVNDALKAIFEAITKAIVRTVYPVPRARALVVAVSADLDSRLRALLKGHLIMHLDTASFQQQLQGVGDILATWTKGQASFFDRARGVIRHNKTSESGVIATTRMDTKHAALEKRLEYIRDFRRNHEQFRDTVARVLDEQYADGLSNHMESSQAVKEIEQAYQIIGDVDVLDTTPSGTERWDHAESLYNARTSRVEAMIIDMLRDRLATTKSTNGSFRILEQFNPLFIRSKVRGAVSDYQAKLIAQVSTEIQRLQDRFKQPYGTSENYAMAQLRDIPPISGAIIRTRQIERQLDLYMNRIESALGQEWEMHAAGAKLREDSDNFKFKLDTQTMYREWQYEVMRKNLNINGRLFTVFRSRAHNNSLRLSVDFEPQVVTLFKEVRNLESMGFKMSKNILDPAKAARRVYPYAVSLTESIDSMMQTNTIIDSLPDVSPLLHDALHTIQRLIIKGIPIRWDSVAGALDENMAQLGTERGVEIRYESKHVQFVRDFAGAAQELKEKTSLLADVNATVQSAIAELELVPYTYEALRRPIDLIQKSIDRINLEGFVNRSDWVNATNTKIRTVLQVRVDRMLEKWLHDFHEGMGAAESQMQPCKHQIVMRDRAIYLEPPLEEARLVWLTRFHSCLIVVCRLPQLQTERFESTLADDGMVSQPISFSDLSLSCVPAIERAYDAIDQDYHKVVSYIDDWLQYQSLWDLQMADVHTHLSDDLAVWLQLIREVKSRRETFDTTETRRNFKLCVVDYEQIQVKVSARYDQWQRELLTQFATRLANSASELYAEITRSREHLENQTLDSSQTSQAVACITVVQTVRRNTQMWEPRMTTLADGQQALMRQRFAFPTSWLPVEQVEHEWASLIEVLDRRAKVIESQSEALKVKIVSEDTILAEKASALVEQWHEEKPISGKLSPTEAISTLQTFESSFTQLSTQLDVVTRAKEALQMPISVVIDLSIFIEEIVGFKLVWNNLKTIWDSIRELREQLWTSVQPRKLRQSLESLLKMTKDMPSRMRQYDAFQHLQSVLQQLIRVNPLLNEMRSDAVKDRHWVQIYKSLRPATRYSATLVTLGDVYDLQLGSSEKTIRGILTQAQGELALEEYLSDVRRTWQEYNLELINYQNKCRLIRGWDELFAKCSEQLNALQAMRHSAYYKIFEDEATTWEDKLNRVHGLFDVWIDVQRQWVYLEGVFSGNAEIKHLLPTESNRFNNINNEFMAVLKKVSKSSLVIEVLAIPGIQKSLERLADQLNRIQKALGEYLERERMSFPRFYFVGDEDLLEIIGNSTDTARISKHLPKMFAGVAGLATDVNGGITAVISREGEQITLITSVTLKNKRVNEWLTHLEQSIKETVATSIGHAADAFSILMQDSHPSGESILAFLDRNSAQAGILAAQIWWTRDIEAALARPKHSLQNSLDKQLAVLQSLASIITQDLGSLQRQKCEHLITEFVHQRDAIDDMIVQNVTSTSHHLWQLQMRHSYDQEAPLLHRTQVKMANATVEYGCEYLGVPDRLVRTPLTDRCFLTLTQALFQRLGGSPYGPAGTGKTESVKALGNQLGRFTLVFNCDDTFDYRAMCRIFLGVSQVGAWGCFDEFNRLEERILSAVSQQIQNIQIGLRTSSPTERSSVDLLGRQIQVHPNTGMFITMNPGYAGRSNLPDNLKKLFRSVAMSKPDKELIAEVMLFSQGFTEAKALSRQSVPFFDQCSVKLSKQPHYDFGLRALKSVLVSAGAIKRDHTLTGDTSSSEASIIVQSLRETIAPKLVSEDNAIMHQIEVDTFPGVAYVPAALTHLREAITEVAQKDRLSVLDPWLTKIIELYQIQGIHHGVMMVGKSSSGKSSAWQTLLAALQQVDGIEGVSYVIDPKVMSKEELYGNMDSTTREWTDGLFTGILRKIVDNLRSESSKRHWIVFDGDVDPEWVENLNSVLDDNRLLTLPNGERLALPSNVRIMFEVETLRSATLATVSRCGMIWFGEATLSSAAIISKQLAELCSVSPEDIDDDTSIPLGQATMATLRAQLIDLLDTKLVKSGLAAKSLQMARQYHHIMEFTDIRALTTLFSLLRKACRDILDYTSEHTDFPLEPEVIESYLVKKVVLALVWSFVGDCPLIDRKGFGDQILALTGLEIPSGSDQTSVIDYTVTLPAAQWIAWESRVPSIEVSPQSISQADLVIPTVDTVRHEDVLYTWLAEHKPLLLCGPPGSGKTMTLFSALRKLPHMEVAGLNFSSATAPGLIVKTLEQHCEYKKSVSGTVLAPTQIGRWLVVFCDEINLPAPDKYHTQRVISFLRQLVERGGFWRSGTTKTWVTLERIQFVGACNPPTDVGRTVLSRRFLRHAPLVMVDYPGQLSLTQIYGTFNTAMLKTMPMLRGYASALTSAMIQMYTESQKRFTPDIHPHYIYSPRELSRWTRAIYEAIAPLEALPLEGLVRLWAHEALRLFSDRLIAEEERQWTSKAVDRIALEHFPAIDEQIALERPILYSDWFTKDYSPVKLAELREYLQARLRTFCEEELDVPLVMFDDLLDHVLRIDRVFKQPQGHMILIGVSGSGKTTMARFVAWSNNLTVFQIKVHGKYSSANFDDDLCNVLRRSGCQAEKICFIMDESNVLDSGFLERMNTLLANGEIPGLFEGDDYAALMTQCKEGSQRQGLLLDSQEELYKWFTRQIIRNLHIVFTMNPPDGGLSSRAATSPALFNRCVLDWFGDWSDRTLYQVGTELTRSIDIDLDKYTSPEGLPIAYKGLQLPATHREVVVNAMVHAHHSLHGFNDRLEKLQGRATFLTPRHFLEFAEQFRKIYREKREDLEEQQMHLNSGLEKLEETVVRVDELSKSLAGKRLESQRKSAEADHKLTGMVDEKKKLGDRQRKLVDIKAFLSKQEELIYERKEQVESQLADALPAVEEAQRSVHNIKKQQLTEVRSMQNPPASVKMALEAVCTLLGHKVADWKSITSVVRSEDFISSIVRYDNERQMTPTHREKMKREYLSKEDFTFERVNRASKACGPLVQWVEAQVNFSGILSEVGPLREELAELEDKQQDTRAHAIVMERESETLETNVANLKRDYASLVTESEHIDQEMKLISTKVERSSRLLESLASEKGRWAKSNEMFAAQMVTIVGDTFLAAAFVTYAGLFDQSFRRSMLDDWSSQLLASNIAHKPHNPIADYLSSADERQIWQEHDLPADELNTENAIMLQRCSRYPLVIDPSGRIVQFLQKQCKDRRLTVTSFLDSSFTKQLESALRFGNPILVQDAEHLDPILNHVLNKEYQKTGGRVLIQLGKQEIDFSPSFKLFLTTRDPTGAFSPDICSRTTFINFTVTQSSLRTQALNDVVKSERPDVDERRINLVKTQGEFRIRLRHLEAELLRSLNEVQGNILENDTVIVTLETLKREASEIATKAAETDGVMVEIEQIAALYSLVASSCASIFAILDNMHHLNHFYQFSLQFFLDIFHSVLGASRDRNVDGERIKIDAMIKDLYVNTYRSTAPTLMIKDRVTFALLLVRASPTEMDRNLIDYMLDQSLAPSDATRPVVDKKTARSMLARLKPFADLQFESGDEAWERFLTTDLAEENLPTSLWSDDTSKIDQVLRGMLAIKLVRIDRLVPCAELLIREVFAISLSDVDDDIGQVVQEAAATQPIALSSSPGFDASFKVDQLVKSTQHACKSVAMGSVEGLTDADTAIREAAVSGSWVLVRNVHLAAGWPQNLEKRLELLRPRAEFRLFLSMESTTKMPVNLLRASRIMTFEQPAGMRANMRDSLLSLSTAAESTPVEKMRVYFLACYLHAIIQERLRYPGVGWMSQWEFNDSDLMCCLFTATDLIDGIAKGRANIAPESIPWSMLRVLVTQIYGGKIDDDDDYRALEELVSRILTPAAFDQEFDLSLVGAQDRADQKLQDLVVPGGTTKAMFVQWVNDKLPEREPPVYLGLKPDAEKQLLAGQAVAMVTDVRKIMEVLDEGEAVSV